MVYEIRHVSKMRLSEIEQMNLYLSYSRTTFYAGNTFYHFRAGLFHGAGWSDLILLAADIDFIELLSLPTYLPPTIAAGTQVRNYDGSLFTVPTDLHLAQLYDEYAFSPISGLQAFLEQGFFSTPEVIYTSWIPGPYTPYLEGFSPSEKPPNVPAYPNFYLPTPGLVEIWIASKFVASPFWTATDFSAWGAYDGCDDSDPYQFPGGETWMDTFIANPGEKPYWKHTGHAIGIDSCNSSFLGFPLVYQLAGPNLYTLTGSVYGPPVQPIYPNPLIWFPDEALEIPPPGNELLPIAAACFVILDVLSSATNGVFAFKAGKLRPSLPDPSYLLVNDTDKLLINDSDLFEVNLWT